MDRYADYSIAALKQLIQDHWDVMNYLDDSGLSVIPVELAVDTVHIEVIEMEKALEIKVARKDREISNSRLTFAKR